MTDKERELALFCLKASSDYHSEVCEECIKYPNCDHMMQDDVIETIIKALEQVHCEVEATQLQKAYNKGFEDCRQAVLTHIYGINGLEGLKLSNVFEKHYADFIKSLSPGNLQEPNLEGEEDDEKENCLYSYKLPSVKIGKYNNEF